jgi:hypothetical protein
MIQSRIRLDGVRELRDTENGVVVQIPANREIPSDSAFPMACIEGVFAQYSLTSRFDQTYLEALRYMAAIHDILAICDRVPPRTADLLNTAVGSLGLTVLTLVPRHVFDEIGLRITDATTSVAAADEKDWYPISRLKSFRPE